MPNVLEQCAALLDNGFTLSDEEQVVTFTPDELYYLLVALDSHREAASRLPKDDFTDIEQSLMSDLTARIFAAYAQSL